MDRKIQGTNQKRYQLLNTWLTDGVRAFRLVADTSRLRPPPRAAKAQVPTRPAEIGNKVEDIRNETGRDGPLSHFGAIVGLDPGQVCTCAAFALPMDPNRSVSQIKSAKAFSTADGEGTRAGWRLERCETASPT